MANSTEEKDVAGTIETLQAQLAALTARQDATDAAKSLLPGRFRKRTLLSSAIEQTQEQARLARVRAAETAELEARAALLRDRPRREKIERKLAPLNARMSAIFAEQQELEQELFTIGRQRAALAVELDPPKLEPRVVIGLRPEDKLIKRDGTMKRVRA
jgi:chromosome segregation ATPase